MTYLGKMKYLLGVGVKKCEPRIYIHQQKYAKEVLVRFDMDHCNKFMVLSFLCCKLIKVPSLQYCVITVPS